MDGDIGDDAKEFNVNKPRFKILKQSRGNDKNIIFRMQKSIEHND